MFQILSKSSQASVFAIETLDKDFCFPSRYFYRNLARKILLFSGADNVLESDASKTGMRLRVCPSTSI